MATNKDNVPTAVKEGRKRQNLQYPLENAEEYKSRLVFEILEEPPTDLDKSLGFVSKKIKELTDAEEEAKKAAGEEEEQKTTEEEVIQLESFRGDNNQTVKRPSTRAKNLGRLVSLYTPNALAIRDTVGYENFDLGNMGAAAMTGASQGITGILSEVVKTGAKTFAAGIVGGADTDMAKLGMINRIGAISDVAAAGVKVAAGVTTNPNTRALFKSVNIRDFAFSFKFLCVSRKESEEVQQIIKFFREELYPEDISIPIGNSEISVGYKFPNKFRIRNFYEGKENLNISRILPCFLRDVSVTYNASTQGMHEEGMPLEIDMNLSFQETRTLARKDIEDGGY